MRNTKILYLQFGVVATSPTSLLEPSLTEDPEDGSGMGSPVLTKYIMRPLDVWKFIYRWQSAKNKIVHWFSG